MGQTTTHSKPHRIGSTAHLGLALTAALLLGACGGVAPAAEGELGTFANECPAGTVKGQTNAWVNIRTEPSLSADKTYVAPQTPLCIATAPNGAPEVVQGQSYTTYDGPSATGQSTDWFRLAREGQTRYIAAFYVDLLESDAPEGPSHVLYLEAHPDHGIRGGMQQRGDATLALDQDARAALIAMEPQQRNAALLQYLQQAMAQLAQQPGTVALVISGHSNGPAIWGDHGTITHQDLANLAQAHPAFAAKVRHLSLLGCNTGWQPTMDQWRRALPNLVSVAGFVDKGPFGAPAYRYFHETFAATRGLGSTIPSPTGLLNTLASRPTASVCNWAFMVFSGGASHYAASKSASLTEARQAYNQTIDEYSGWFAADGQGFSEPPQDTGAELWNGHFTPRKHYNNLHAYRAALAIALQQQSEQLWFGETAGRLAQLDAELAQAIRLTFYRTCKQRWLAAHAAELDGWLGSTSAQAIVDGYNAAVSAQNSQTHAIAPGQQVSRDAMERMSRMETNDFVDALRAGGLQGPMVERLEQALVQLTPGEIPDAFIE